MIYAANAGSVVIKNGSVAVMPVKEIKKIDRGMLVIGTVTDDVGSVVFVKIDGIRSNNRELVALKDGKIITKTRMQRFGRGPPGRGPPGRGFHRDRDERGMQQEKPCQIGDTVIARVIGEDNDIYVLGLAAPEAGVVYARCDECGALMEKDPKTGMLVCRRDKKSGSRKLSIHYNNPEGIKKLFS